MRCGHSRPRFQEFIQTLVIQVQVTIILVLVQILLVLQMLLQMRA